MLVFRYILWNSLYVILTLNICKLVGRPKHQSVVLGFSYQLSKQAIKLTGLSVLWSSLILILSSYCWCLGQISQSDGIKLAIGKKRKSEEHQKVEGSPNDRKKKISDTVSPGVSLAFSSKKVEKEKPEAVLKAKKGSVAKAFGEDSDSEEEEMPKEARMRMRNIGRNTPTSAGPNSYNKGKLGFTNRNKMWDREMKPRIHLEKPPDSE